MSCEEWYRTGRQLELSQYKVFYKRDGVGPALVCLHGFPTSSWDFSPVWSGLIKKFDCIAPDLIGLGRSSKPQQTMTVALQADMVENLLHKLNIGEAHLFVHDLGDTVAQELLARQTEGSSQVKWLSCVFLNGGLFPETHRPRLIQVLLLTRLAPLILKFSTKRTFKPNMKNIFSPLHPPSDDFIDQSWELLCEEDGLKMMPLLLNYLRERESYRSRWVSPLEQDIVPMRLINGVLDPVSGYHAAKRFTELVENPDVVFLDEAGHYPHVEVPEEVLEHFLQFHARSPGNRVYN
ncbi:MAG: alpha/beta hydrolase [Cyclobacteriaceae bacterium]|nr:alpha/beta hydrolase [Cyclobacteriaceae bacterium]